MSGQDHRWRGDERHELGLEVTEISRYGFQAKADAPLPLGLWCDTTIRLGAADASYFRALALRHQDDLNANGICGFEIGAPDLPWRKFVSALYRGTTYGDLENATRFLET